MIRTITGNSANDVWCKTADLYHNKDIAQAQTGRGGETIELLHIGFSIEDPRQRWVVSRFPPINIAFALAEVVWLIQGRNDSLFLNYWNSQLPKYSGCGPKYYGAYGYRLRYNLGIDQLSRAYQALKANQDSRQIVLQIWDSTLDLPISDGQPMNEDIPCNIVSILKIRRNKLEWLQIMRSNDLFLGTPHNFVQFTYLQEIIAGWLNVDLGSYNHISDSIHVYKKDLGKIFNYQKLNTNINNDSVAVCKDKSDSYFKELSCRIDCLISKELSRKKIEKLSEWYSENISFQNILLVLCAEAARKRRWKDLSENFMKRCSNPVFNQLWDLWLHRVNKKYKSI